MNRDVNDLEGFRCLIDELKTEYLKELGEPPTKVMIPGTKWFLVDLAIIDKFDVMSDKMQREVISNGSAKMDLKFEGLDIFGTIREIHVK